MTRVSAGRAPSGARLLGDDVQHLIVWYHALLTQNPKHPIAELRVEAADAGNVDDLTITFASGQREYWQVKASVEATALLNEKWLFESDGKAPSLLRRLHRSWADLTKDDVHPSLVFATTRAIDPADPVLSRRSTTDCRLFQFLSADGAAADRKRWADHLGVSEPELMRFLEDLKILHGQSEPEWRHKVRDAGIASNVKVDEHSIARGMQQVRDWVKAPRRTLSAGDISASLTALNLFCSPTSALLVVQALEHDPRAATADAFTDWISLFDGSDPRERRFFRDPGLAKGQVRADLRQVRSTLRGLGRSSVVVVGTMRLPMWFATGTELGANAGFVVSAYCGTELWSATTTPAPGPQILVTSCSAGVGELVPELAVSVSVSTRIESDVDDYIAASLPGVEHLALSVQTPGRLSVPDAAAAVRIAVEARDAVRDAVRSVRPHRVHLFLATPAAIALFLGHWWDRMPPTTVYWDGGVAGYYRPALDVVN